MAKSSASKNVIKSKGKADNGAAVKGGNKKKGSFVAAAAVVDKRLAKGPAKGKKYVKLSAKVLKNAGKKGGDMTLAEKVQNLMDKELFHSSVQFARLLDISEWFDAGKCFGCDVFQMCLLQDVGADATLVAIKKDLSNNELAAVHSQYKTFRKANPEEDEAYKTATKTEKGCAALNWYLSKINCRFSATSASIGSSWAASKTERWMSHKQALDAFGQEDLESHVTSGRLSWRESPVTKGCVGIHGSSRR